ncbi:Ish1 domain-containing protein [Lactococcus protaetiae]|uniref:HeH/LEM domain-containing protein n=1 Tax=Lactococcus protaetiae TaxID=2592653 RepID=A0A514Z6X7_9LACT|nr:Ish1 domain-containing protein [Lactococcus protaetiae]QDK70341.1 hypothetical protein FLP15_03120 [Lactococcus protaetiae]
MKQYKVEQRFKDNDTGVVYEVGELYPKFPTDERIAELLGDTHPNHEGAILSEIEEKPNKDTKVEDIKKYLDSHGIKHEGITKKDELLALID